MKSKDLNGAYIVRMPATMATLDAAYAWWKETRKWIGFDAMNGDYLAPHARRLFDACEKSFSPKDVQDYYEKKAKEARVRTAKVRRGTKS